MNTPLLERVTELAGHERWTRTQVLEHRRHALRELVRHAFRRSRYYREALGPESAYDGDVVLERLPTLPKATLMEEWDRVVTDPSLRLAEVERHLGSSAATEPYLGEYRVCETGGSTGARGTFAYAREEFEILMAGMLRGIVVAGIRPEMRLASISSPSPLHLSNLVFAAFRAGRAGSPPLTVTMPLARVVAALNEYRPEAITTHAGFIGLLAHEQLEGRLRIEPRVIGTGSEVLGDEVRQLAREAWGIEVNDVYVSTEGGMMATECAAHCGSHVWEDHLILEVVDEQNRPVPPGVPGFRVLVTNLWNRTQPLIRYELADSATLAGGPNPTGRPFARIARIDGRSDDILRLPARAGGDVAVHPLHLRAAFARLPQVRQFQLEIDGERLRLRVVLAPDATRDIPERTRKAVVDALEAAGAVAPAVEVEPVGAIDRVGTGAKLTLVRSRARGLESMLTA